jgi:hypothetical protein
MIFTAKKTDVFVLTDANGQNMGLYQRISNKDGMANENAVRAKLEGTEKHHWYVKTQ